MRWSISKKFERILEKILTSSSFLTPCNLYMNASAMLINPGLYHSQAPHQIQPTSPVAILVTAQNVLEKKQSLPFLFTHSSLFLSSPQSISVAKGSSEISFFFPCLSVLLGSISIMLFKFAGFYTGHTIM